MSAKIYELQQILRERGYSVTSQRQAVFEALLDKEPISMSDLCAQLIDTLDRASVYRTVALFEELGIVQRINIGWKYKLELSDTFAEHHHHLSCLHCHAIIPMSEQELETFISSVAAKHAFIPTRHQVEIQGICAICADKQQNVANIE